MTTNLDLKTHALASLLGMVAHDCGNTLSAVLAHAEFLEDDLADPSIERKELQLQAQKVMVGALQAQKKVLPLEQIARWGRDGNLSCCPADVLGVLQGLDMGEGVEAVEGIRSCAVPPLLLAYALADIHQVLRRFTHQTRIYPHLVSYSSDAGALGFGASLFGCAHHEYATNGVMRISFQITGPFEPVLLDRFYWHELTRSHPLHLWRMDQDDGVQILLDLPLVPVTHQRGDLPSRTQASATNPPATINQKKGGNNGA